MANLVYVDLSLQRRINQFNKESKKENRHVISTTTYGSSGHVAIDLSVGCDTFKSLVNAAATQDEKSKASEHAKVILGSLFDVDL